MKRSTTILTAFGGLLFIVLGSISSSGGLRGSDQYWYVADTESLLQGRGVQTNYITPYNLVGDTAVHNHGFVHNVPPVYMAVLPALFVGSFAGWLVMNASATLLTAILLFTLLKRSLSPDLSALAALLYLFIPLTFWQAFQPLAESFHALLMTSMLYLYQKNRDITRYFWIGILLVVLLLCRNNYILVAIGVSIVFYLELQRKFGFMLSLAFLGTVLLLFYILKSFFPDTYNYSYAYVSATGIVGELRPSTILDLMAVYARRAVDFFATQFLTVDSTAVFYQPFNLFALGTLVIWIGRSRRRMDAPILLVAASLAFLFLTAVIAWYQARYVLPFYPLVMFAFFTELGSTVTEGVHRRLVPGVLMASLVVCLAIDSVITQRTIREGRAERAIRVHYSTIYDGLMPDDESLIYSNQSWDQREVYILRPRMAFLGSEEAYLATERYTRLIEKYRVNWFLAQKDLGVRATFPEYALEMEKEIPPFAGEPGRYLYRVVRWGEKGSNSRTGLSE